MLKIAKITTPLCELLRISQSQAKEKLRECYSKYAEFKQQAGKKRKNWLIELASERAMAEEAKQNNSTRQGHKKKGNKHATAKQIQMIRQVEGT